MIDKAFALREIATEAIHNPLAMMAGYAVMEADTEDERNYALNMFAMTVVGLTQEAMSRLLLTDEDFTALTDTLGELIEIAEIGEDN